jgi:Tfp pilus assembly protein PilE
MMDYMTGGVMMWGMGMLGLLTIVVLVLAIAALLKYPALASTVFAQRKAGWRAALRSEPVTIPGCSAMQRNHWPPSLTTVVPASTREQRRLDD